jgi:hypothetical protein
VPCDGKVSYKLLELLKYPILRVSFLIEKLFRV